MIDDGHDNGHDKVYLVNSLLCHFFQLFHSFFRFFSEFFTFQFQLAQIFLDLFLQDLETVKISVSECTTVPGFQ